MPKHAGVRRTGRCAVRTAASAFALALATTAVATDGKAGSAQVRRGEYLAVFGGCNDCHTPKTMTPNGPVPDKSRLLSGHPAAVALPAIAPGALSPDGWIAATNKDLTAWVGPWGVSYAANLTPDKTTGLGAWTVDQFVRAMRTGKHLGTSRPILPPMPWENVGALNDADLKALFAYFMSIKPIANQVPPPAPPK
jgi:mono/diheme cytochrome c family protein